jgi:hypothetical protein
MPAGAHGRVEDSEEVIEGLGDAVRCMIGDGKAVVGKVGREDRGRGGIGEGGQRAKEVKLVGGEDAKAVTEE